jgi:hypothetical protein
MLKRNRMRELLFNTSENLADGMNKIKPGNQTTKYRLPEEAHE